MLLLLDSLLQECYRIKMSAQTKVEVTRGVFDPRTYKQEDKQNWARKRKPEWMATTGQIHFVRERTVASQERELEEERKAEAAQEESCQELKEEAPRELKKWNRENITLFTSIMEIGKLYHLRNLQIFQRNLKSFLHKLTNIHSPVSKCQLMRITWRICPMHLLKRL